MIRRAVLILLMASPVLANDNVGTSGAQFLKIGAGARPTAMGDAFVGVADDVNAVYFNPAGLAYVKQAQITAMRTNYFQDMNYDFGAFSIPTSHGVFGLSAATLQVEDLNKRNESEGDEGSFEVLDAAYGLSYGRHLNETMALGLTLRYIKQEIDSTSASAWSSDIGFFNRLKNRPMTVGVALRHFGQEIKFNEEGDPQPLTLDVGAGYRFLSERLLLAANLKQSRDNDLQFGLGSEWNQRLGADFKLALRAGYNSTGTDADGTTGISFGGGIGFKQFDLDVAWVPFGDLGNTMRYAVVVKF